ncbi:MAG: hypothetical protein JOZ87_05370, partial [Chloroflexi bacterium]|nr:hypothetical protein [Chloroflexota bacterium]
DAPPSIVAQLGPDGIMTKDGQVTPDGYAVNTSYSINTPHPANVTDTSMLVPEQTAPTIGDRLNDAGVAWAWYSGGWDNAVIGHPDPLFQFHHQPFAFTPTTRMTRQDAPPTSRTKVTTTWTSRPGSCRRSPSSSHSAPITSIRAMPRC